jgi:hypothetical protein
MGPSQVNQCDLGLEYLVIIQKDKILSELETHNPAFCHYERTMEDFHVVVENSLDISVLMEQPTVQLALCHCIPYIYHRSARQGQHDESFSCILCNEEFNISQEDIENHCEKAEHVKRLGELKVHLERIKEMSRRFLLKSCSDSRKRYRTLSNNSAHFG